MDLRFETRPYRTIYIPEFEIASYYSSSQRRLGGGWMPTFGGMGGGVSNPTLQNDFLFLKNILKIPL